MTALDTGDTLLAPARSWKTPVTLAVFAVALTVLGLAVPRGGEASFRLASGTDFFAVPNLVVPVTVSLWAGVILIALLAAASAFFVRTANRSPGWIVTAAVVILIMSFLAWATAGQTLPIPGLLAGAVALAVPLTFGGLGGVIGERVGIVNIAIEGQLLGGAFTAAMVSTLTGSAFLGMLGAAVAGMLVAAVLAVFAIRYAVDQVIVGVVLNVLVIGLTSFLFTQLMQPNIQTLNTPVSFPRVPIPVLSQIPLLGPVLFNQTVLVYLLYITVFAVWFAMFRTRWGLRLRAVGEHPQAADTVGINVERTRYRNVLLAGAIAGTGGTIYTVGNGIAFSQEMTAGAGFIALAAVIFGQWHPIKVALAALLFGFASSLQNSLSVIQAPVPSDFMLMVPYVVTIAVVAGVVGTSRPPAAAGKPYRKA